MATKMEGQHFFHPSLLLLFFLSGIRDVYPGSATLVFSSLADSHHAFTLMLFRIRLFTLMLIGHCHHCVAINTFATVS
jgi:hypothetical protein